MKSYLTVDALINAHPKWKAELTKLTEILHKTELVDTIKWGLPTYTINNKNVLGVGAFKSYVVIWFFNGVYLKDTENVLVNAQEGKTKALRQWRFYNVNDINEPLLLSYVNEAIDNQLKGLELKPTKVTKTIISKELLHELKKDTSLYLQFTSLPPYKQKEYHEYIESAKRMETKLSRIKKSIDLILKGIGLNDKYRP